jgi:hypothetical protein
MSLEQIRNEMGEEDFEEYLENLRTFRGDWEGMDR